MKNEKSGFNQPLYTLKALNYWRYLSIITLILIAVFSFILIRYIGFIAAIIGLYCFSMVLFIRFPRIDLYEDYFEIVKESVYKGLTVRLKYNYRDLKNVKFSKGFNNGTMLLISGGSSGLANEQYSKTDTIILTLTNNKNFEINRIGSRKNFINLIEQISIKIAGN
jgi:hypothetical protein